MGISDPKNEYMKVRIVDNQNEIGILGGSLKTVPLSRASLEEGKLYQSHIHLESVGAGVHSYQLIQNTGETTCCFRYDISANKEIVVHLYEYDELDPSAFTPIGETSILTNNKNRAYKESCSQVLIYNGVEFRSSTMILLEGYTTGSTGSNPSGGGSGGSFGSTIWKLANGGYYILQTTAIGGDTDIGINLIWGV